MSTTLVETNSDLLQDGLCKVPEAVQFLRISKSKIYQLMEDGELAYCKMGKSRRIPRRALREYAEKALVRG